MNIQDLISSGKLELYVAGALSETEMREITAMAQTSPELADEIRKIESSIIQLYSSQVQHLDKKEMDANLEKIFASGTSNSIAPVIPISPVHSTTKVFSISKFAVAAMIGGIVLTSALSVLMLMQNQSLRTEMASIRTQQQNLLAENDSMQKKSELMQTRFEMVRNILSKRVELKAIAGKAAPEDFMLVYWNPKTRQVMMADANLPSLPADQQYQLWALLDNVQVDLGVFDGGKGIPASFMKNAENAKGFAVTVEPRGGSQKPTMENLKVMANL